MKSDDNMLYLAAVSIMVPNDCWAVVINEELHADLLVSGISRFSELSHIDKHTFWHAQPVCGHRGGHVL